MVIPAIDLRNGKCVRLRQGNFAEEKIYAEDPVKAARQWENDGAGCLHVVDLDGARCGQPVNSKIILKIAAAVKIPVQTGGGLRTASQIQRLLDNGVSRAIIGTAACESDDVVKPLIQKFKSKLAVGIDARAGLVQTRGWTHTTALKAADLAGRLDKMGVATLIYTDTHRDGMLTGPNLEGIADLCRRVKCGVIASGGVSCVDDIIKLRALALQNLTGIIVGKALYERKIPFSILHE